MDLDSEGCSQPEGLGEVHYSLLRVGTGQTRGDSLLCLHERHRLEDLDAEDTRTADSAGRSSEGEGR